MDPDSHDEYDHIWSSSQDLMGSRPATPSDAQRRPCPMNQELNMIANVCLSLALVAAVFGAPSQPQYGYAPPPSHEDPAKYDFNYAVKDDYSGNDFGHQEARDGYDTQGSYYVLLPDGRLQKVSYNVNGDSGFVAEVTYEGEPQYNPVPSYA
ncbi:pro-resilin-like [Palaemon carinicauda]|uniref:pro-resilin-like n=1 Tax=Palaemon carinicauda TaxID=392227 RepID=UPI0035B5C4A0